MKFYFGLSEPTFQVPTLGVLQSWLENAQGDLKVAIQEVSLVIRSPMQAGEAMFTDFYECLIVVALAMATKTDTEEPVTVADEKGTPVVFEKADQCRQYLKQVGVVSEERYQEAWDILADLGVMSRKLDLSVVADPSTKPADEFCF